MNLNLKVKNVFSYLCFTVMICVQSALIYGTETWAMKKANLQSLERTERMMVRWMCMVSLKDIKRSVNLYSILGVQGVAEVVRHVRLRWFGARCEGRKRKTWGNVWGMT